MEVSHGQTSIKLGRLRKRDQAYLFIKQLLLEGDAQPGDSLDINAIAHTLGMSRTPVLEAITLLEREGWLSIIPQVGVFVRIVPSHELFQRIVARAALEGLLAQYAARAITSQTLDELEKLLREMEQPTTDALHYSELNRRFHALIHEAADMPLIHEMVNQLWDTLEYTGLAKQLFADRAASLREHRVILAALQRRDPQAAREAAEHHVLRVAELFAPLAQEAVPSDTRFMRSSRRLPKG